MCLTPVAKLLFNFHIMCASVTWLGSWVERIVLEGSTSQLELMSAKLPVSDKERKFIFAVTNYVKRGGRSRRSREASKKIFFGPERHRHVGSEILDMLQRSFDYFDQALGQQVLSVKIVSVRPDMRPRWLINPKIPTQGPACDRDCAGFLKSAAQPDN